MTSAAGQRDGSAGVSTPPADHHYTISEACAEVDMLYRVIAERERELDMYRRDSDDSAETVGKLLAERIQLLAERDALRTQLETAHAAAKRKSWRGW